MRKSVSAVAAGSVVVLVAAGCATQTSDSVSGAPADSSGSSLTIVTQPEDNGQVITGSIESATTSVDIPIYSIGGTEIVAALAKAKSNGVNIRIMTNGGYGAYAPGILAVQKALAAAPGSGTVQVNWSSNNFNVTHQKSVIVDAADKNGQPIPAGNLPPTAKVVISTGNFQDFNGPFWSARDFDMVSTDPEIISDVEEVFASDFSCPTYTVINPNGLGATDRLVWSNGSTGFTANNTYPVSYPFPPWPASVVNQGNGREAYLDVITNAGQGDILRFTNEELTDPAVVSALLKAATPASAGGQGADVRILMSLPKGYTAATAQTYAKTLNGIWQIVKAGGTAHMFANNSDVPAALYIHGKMAVRNSDRAMVGSENAGYMSLNANRELGMNLTSADSDAVSTLVSTFDKDWALTDDWVTVWTKANVPTPTSALQSQELPPQSNVDLRATGGFPTTGQMKCGPVVAPTAKR